MIRATFISYFFRIFHSEHAGYGKCVNILFCSQKEEIISLHSAKAHVRFRMINMAVKGK